MAESTFDPDVFNAFEHHGWETTNIDAYQEVFGPITSLAIDPLLDAASVRRGSRVLDVATGPGYVAARATERGAVVTAIDLSEQMLEIAVARNPAAKILKGDAEDIPLPDASFNAVVANFCILHLGRPERAASEFARVLQAGGSLARTGWNAPEQNPLMAVVTESVRAGGALPSSLPSGPDFYRFASDSEFSGLLSGAGLQKIRVQTLHFKHTVPSTDHLWRGFAEGGVRNRALLMLQSEAVRRQIRSEFDRRLAAFKTSKGYEVPLSVKLASGAKPENR